MKLKLYIFPSILIISFALLFIFKDGISNYMNFRISTLSYYGSTGQEVIDIQVKLSNWGYYSGIVDGVYGYDTYLAIRKFQEKNGLAVDGVAGSDTLASLGLNSYVIPASANTSSSYNNNVNLMAHLIYGEARGEPYLGKVAIGGVILNRARDSRFPKTIAGVIYQSGAFDAVSDGQIDLDPDSTSYKAAADALNGWDPSGGAIYYFNPNTATSRWIWTRTIIKVIGQHYFCK